MAVPPLALTALRLSPYTCFAPTTPNTLSTPSYEPVPSHDVPTPPPPSDFTLSPTAHYPAPFGNVSLGSTFSAHMELRNTSEEGVRGVKMMLEIQGPSGRYRLGEVIHGKDTLPSGQSQDPATAGGEGKGATKAEPAGRAEGVEHGDKAEESSAIARPPEVLERDPSEESILDPQTSVGLDVSAEMKDLGVNVLICSVAWETPDGRRTFQRFFKFNVTPPLAIKTRIHTPSSAASQLDPIQRSEIYLEVVLQNTSMTGLAFDKVVIEPVKGMVSRSAGGGERPTTIQTHPEARRAISEKPFAADATDTLFPDDTRQYIFILSPDPRSSTSESDYDPLPLSTFPPIFTPGTILPLGRLDVSWFSGPYRDPGRLQTSTLNRRVPMTPIAPPTPASGANAGTQLQHTRTTSAVPASPAGPMRALPPVQSSSSQAIEAAEAWEYDLAIDQIEREVEVESEFTVKVRLGARTSTTATSDSDATPPNLHLAIQYLSLPSPDPLDDNPTLSPTAPTMNVTGPSRSSTPLSLPSIANNLGVSRSAAGTPGPSRPLTPVSAQLRQAASSALRPQANMVMRSHSSSAFTSVMPPPHRDVTAFPPEPNLSGSATDSKLGTGIQVGEVIHLGSSLVIIPAKRPKLVRERLGTPPTSSNAEEAGKARHYWESTYELELRFLAMEEGVASLGGLRVLSLDGKGDDTNEEQKEFGSLQGATGREWATLGDVWVT